MKKFKKIISILSIIIALLGCGSAIFFFISSQTMESIEFFGPLPNLLTFGLGITIIFFSIISIIDLWINYAIVKYLYNSYKNGNKLPMILSITILIIIVIFIIIYNIYNNNNKDVYETLNNVANRSWYEKTTYYFIHNDKIYYYYSDKHQLYVMNLNGSNNKLLCKSDELRYANFAFVYNNYAYYSISGANKKVNLSTGEITDVIGDGFILANTFDGNTANTYHGTNKSVKINLDKNTLIYTNEFNEDMDGKEYFIDYENGDIYYTESLYRNPKNNKIYKNDTLLYDFDTKCNFLLKHNNYLFLYNSSNIYKFNLKTKTIDKKFNYNINNLTRISSGNNNDNYFYGKNKIYTFNVQNDEFECLLENIPQQPEYVYRYNDKIIFTNNTDYIRKDILGSVIIYDLNEKTHKIYDKIRKASFDEDKLYLINEENEEYTVNQIDL